MKLTILGLAGVLLATGAINSARADAATGAILGGVAGGVIGHQSRETAAGVIVGATAGALIGQALDRDNGPRGRTHVVYQERCAPLPPPCPPRPVVYRDYYPRPRPVVIITQSPPPPPAIIVTSTSTTIGADCGADEYGYTSAQYLALLKPGELVVLRQRAYGCDSGNLTAFLTEREKGNLRARAAREVVIGES